MFKALCGLAPSYITELLSACRTARPLRSTDQELLTIPLSRWKLPGDRAFSGAAPKLWNSLSSSVSWFLLKDLIRPTFTPLLWVTCTPHWCAWLSVCVHYVLCLYFKHSCSVMIFVLSYVCCKAPGLFSKWSFVKWLVVKAIVELCSQITKNQPLPLKYYLDLRESIIMLFYSRETRAVSQNHTTLNSLASFVCSVFMQEKATK